MRPCIWHILGLLLVAFSTGVVEPARAQPAVEPAATAAAAPSRDSASGAAASPATRDPLVDEVLALNPQSPEQLVQAASTLVNLGALTEARALVEKLLAAQLAPEALVALEQRFGSDTFLHLARERGLDPAGAELARRVIGAADQLARSPERLQAALDRLAGGDPAQRALALAVLSRGGSDAVVALLDRLQRVGSQAEAERLRGALVRLGPFEVLEPLTVLLPEVAGPARLQLSALAGELGDPSAAYELWPFAWAGTDEERSVARQALALLGASLPDPREAAERLVELAEAAWTGEVRPAPDAAVETPAWSYQAAEQRLVRAPRSLALQQAERTARRARAAFLLARRSEEPELSANEAALAARLLGPAPAEDGLAARARELYLLASIEGEALTADSGAGQVASPAGPLWEALAADLQGLEELLSRALAEPRPTAAIRLLDALRGRLDDVWLNSPAGRPRVVVEALRHEHPRVRWGALEAVLAAEPSAAFAGQSWVDESLAFFATATGRRRAWVADSRPQEAARLAGWLNGQGFHAETTCRVRDLVQRATSSADTELIVLSLNLDVPSAAETLEMLRHDHRTALVPVVLVTGLADEEAAHRLAGRFSRTVALLRPHDEAGIEVLLRRALAQRAPWPVEAPERLSWSATAWSAIAARGAASAGAVASSLALDTTLEALLRAELEPAVLAALAGRGERTAQSVLVDWASQPRRSLAARRQAAAAFAQSVERFGVLLSPQAIATQYDRYNASEQAEAETQQVLGSLLDTLEAAASPSARDS